MPKIVLSTGSFFPNTELGFRMAAEHGYDGVEVMVTHDRRSQTVDAVGHFQFTFHVRGTLLRFQLRHQIRASPAHTVVHLKFGCRYLADHRMRLLVEVFLSRAGQLLGERTKVGLDEPRR